VKQPDADCNRHLKALMSSFGKKSVLAKDVERLVKVKGPGACR